MMSGTTLPKSKVTITLGHDVLDEVRSRVELGEARSESAYIQHAVQSQLADEADLDGVAALVNATATTPGSLHCRA